MKARKLGLLLGEYLGYVVALVALVQIVVPVRIPLEAGWLNKLILASCVIVWMAGMFIASRLLRLDFGDCFYWPRRLRQIRRALPRDGPP